MTSTPTSVEMTIEEFAKEHSACNSGFRWAQENCPTGTMREAWDKLPTDWLVWVGTRKGVLSDRERRLFAVDCARRALARLKNPDPRSMAAVDTAEAYANGTATAEQLETARKAAWSVAGSSAWSAASAVGVAAWSAASAAEATEVWALEASCSATDCATWSNSGNDERKAQAAWLRANTTPCFRIQQRGGVR